MLPESLRTALGTVIAQCRQEWRRESELIGAQAREVMAQAREAVADFRARVVELDAQLREAHAARLASLQDGKDGQPGRDGKDAEPGRDGVDGKDGEPGRDGLAGQPGKDGLDGRDGEPGHNGNDGKPGKDGVNGKDGELGRDGLDGKPGKDGEPGRDGIDGQPGKDGIDGKNGEPGRDGVDGQPGKDGIDGKNGEPGRAGLDGQPGKDGVDGKDGEPGKNGAPGKMPAAKAWAPGVHYEAELRTFEGALWQAERDTAAEPGDGDDWTMLAAAGRDGRAPRFAGTYAAGLAYRELDVVALNGGSFVALRDAPGTCPGDGWQLVVSRGKAGQPGKDGLDGRDGAPGLNVASWRIDRKGYALQPVLADGTTGPAIDLRELFEQFRADVGV